MDDFFKKSNSIFCAKFIFFEKLFLDWGAKYFLAALLGGAIVGFLIIGIVIIFICHTVKKRDQGTYVVKDKYTAGQQPPPSYQYGSKSNMEFYA